MQDCVVDMLAVRELMVAQSTCGAPTALKASDADRMAQRHTLSGHSPQLQTMGAEGTRGGWSLQRYVHSRLSGRWTRRNRRVQCLACILGKVVAVLLQTSVTHKQPHLLRLLTQVAKERHLQYTTIQVNQLMSGKHACVALHADQCNGTRRHHLTSTSSAQAGSCGSERPPAHLGAPPEHGVGRWYELCHGELCPFDPTLWHATDVVCFVCRCSVIFSTAAALERVPLFFGDLQHSQFGVDQLCVQHSLAGQYWAHVAKHSGWWSHDELFDVLVHDEHESLSFAVRCGVWSDRTCLWRMLCDSQLPALIALRALAVHDMQGLGFVGLKPASEEVQAHSDFTLNVGCGHQVIVFVSHETVFPMSESPEEMSTMPRSVRRSLKIESVFW
eukprot:2245714-Amphidinium_carterae.1